MPRVSYVVTVYNKAPSLPCVVDGLAAQAGAFDREFVFVDDGSTDESRAVLADLTAGWPRCRILVQANGGPALALAAGLAAAEGDFIKTLDGDDVLTPGATAALMDAVAATGAGMAFGPNGSYRLADGRDEVRRQAQAAAGSGRPVLVPDPLRATLRHPQTTTSSWLARGDLVRRLGCDTGVYVQDYSIELRLAQATPFARVPLAIFLQPEVAPGRMSEQKIQTLHDVNLAVARFVARTPELSPAIRRLAFERTAQRAWHYARREAGRSWLGPEFRRFLGARLGLLRAEAAAIEATCAIFRATRPIKLMAAR
jgi:glycosyltransferase involved in cell wall biosynthesis